MNGILKRSLIAIGLIMGFIFAPYFAGRLVLLLCDFMFGIPSVVNIDRIPLIYVMGWFVIPLSVMLSIGIYKTIKWIITGEETGSYGAGPGR
jgi:hypothetical protein